MAAAKSQPKAFQFIEGRPSQVSRSQENDKENATPKQTAIEGGGKDTDHTLSSQRTIPPPKLPPSTPATRLPLADLIGNTEDTNRVKVDVKVSPEDYIHWHANKSPRTTSTPVTRGKKRARSSSPPSSSCKEASAHFLAKEDALNAPGFKQPLKTPQTDPTQDLWNRYATNTTKDTPLRNQFAHLLNSSSPHTTDDQGSNVSGLRRWTSCGMEWPSSKTKRRKTRPTISMETVEDVFTDAEADDKGEESGIPRIGTLLERIQESLAMPKETTEPKGPSSSSPLPDRGEQFDRKSISPCRASDLARNGGANQTEYTLVEDSESRRGVPTRPESDSSKFSSFGSDELDIDDMVNMGRAAIENDNTASNIELTIQKLPAAEVDEAAHAVIESDGEDFGDDQELSMAELENVASLYDKRETTSGDNEGQKYASSAIVSNNIQNILPSSAENEFGDDDIDEESFVAAEIAATQKGSKGQDLTKPSDLKPRTIQRYLIKEVSEGLYTTDKGEERPEKVLLVSEERTALYKAITLRQSWFDTRCTKGSFVHVIGEFSSTGQCLIDDAQNMLILHPDHLMSALVVADSFSCMRKAVLQDRIKATSESSPPMVYGTMLHELFQEALKANRWDDEWLLQTIETIVSRHIEDLYEIKLTVEQVVEHLRSKLPELRSWAEVFIQESPKSNALIKDRNGKQILASINKLLDVEEHIWSPMYGLKGNIDATVQISMQDEQGPRTLTVPLEVKTGKNSSNASHRAQTALYTLLLSDRYDIAVAYGILYYMETSETSRIPAIRHELRHMIMQRNELACYVRERLSLPPMIKNTHICTRCYAKNPCFLYHSLAENGDGETSGMRSKFEEVVRHLKPADRDFFKKWDDLLTKEESEMMKFKRELWTMLSTEREKLGRCFANVSLDPRSAIEDRNTSKINRFQYGFRKHGNLSGFSFGESQITVGEPIVISDEKGHYALAKGYVTSISEKRISVAVDRRLHNTRTKQKGFDPDTNQVFAGMMEVGKEALTASTMKQSQSQDSPMLFRLDKDEFSNGMATVRNNLIQVMTNDVFHSSDIRRLIIDGMEPRFKPSSSAYSLSGPQSQASVNEDQHAAIEKIMSAQDYALVLGMPGTGKTTTIAHIIRTLVAKGKSVLLTSYTHTAVDNILLKIKQDKVRVLRLGAVTKIHPEVREFAVLGGEPKTSIEELEKSYTEPQVVATTCLGVSHQVFNERIFDYCIVDEASQITLPVCLGPIRMAKTFVLVGDHYQLPPLVQNREALQGGLDISLFKLLSERHPSAVATLHHQYRMNEAIMSISNTLIYSGRLKCGSEDIASRRLDLPHYASLQQLHHTCTSLVLPDACSTLNSRSCWLQRTLDPSTSPPVLFLNTDTLLPESTEKAHGPRITNILEATLCTQLISALLIAGAPANTIGLITLYRSQLSLLKSQLQDSTYGIPAPHAALIEAHTADRYQGRDKDVVIISCVRSNDRRIVGDLLKDWRRVNVAMTRARRKLIIVGSRGTLAGGDELLAKLVKLCDENDWMVDLPQNAADENAHNWSCASSPPFESQLEQEDVLVPTVCKEKAATEQQPVASVRQPLGARALNRVPTSNCNPKFKVPTKVGNVPTHVALGGRNMKEKRPILKDIINDVIGDDLLR